MLLLNRNTFTLNRVFAVWATWESTLVTCVFVIYALSGNIEIISLPKWIRLTHGAIWPISNMKPSTISIETFNSNMNYSIQFTAISYFMSEHMFARHFQKLRHLYVKIVNQQTNHDSDFPFVIRTGNAFNIMCISGFRSRMHALENGLQASAS